MKHVGIVCQTKLDDSADGMTYNRAADDLVEAVEAAGMIPQLIPVTDLEELSDYFLRLDGLIFAGTLDVAPFYYGDEPSDKLGPIEPAQDQFELTLLKLAINRLPILGIERGAQLINIACGGTLKPITSRVIHQGEGTHYHSLSPRKGTQMYDIYGARLIVASNHSHEIAEIGKDLKWTAKAPDGVVEAIEHQYLPIIGVQFPIGQLDQELKYQLFQAFHQLL